jgi:hypothetical protein
MTFLLFVMLDAIKTIRANFPISEGCMLNPPILIHLDAPFRFCPIPGIRTATNIARLTNINHLEYFSSFQ